MSPALIFSIIYLFFQLIPVKGDDSSFAIDNVGATYFLVVILVLHSAMFAGLTLGLLSLDKVGLEILIGGDDQKLAKYAKALYPIREDGNFLLCTLLLGTVATNSMLSILLADIASGLYGFILSTVLIVLFGEIIPQSVCSRPEYGLLMGYYAIPIIKFYSIIFYISSKPLSMILNYTLGEDIGTIHTRTGLRKMLEIHVKQGALDIESGNVVDGALKYKDMTVREVMTDISDAYMLSVHEILNFKTLAEIFKHGFSRIPVYNKDKNDIVGLLLAKDLIFVDPEDSISVSSFINLFGRPLHLVWPDEKLGQVLKVFKRGKSHMGIVRDVNNTGPGDPYYEVKGIITLEDIIEEILGEEIVDETDNVEDGTGFGLGDVVSITTAGGQNMTNRDMDFARLRLLNPDTVDEHLSDEETRAVAAHLRANVPQLRVLLGYAESEEPPIGLVEAIVQQSRVIRLNKQGGALRDPNQEEALYKRGKPSETCTLVISGTLEVRAGKDGFKSELGPFSLIGADALLDLPEGYTPDFSAVVSSDTLRCLQITRRSCLINGVGASGSLQTEGAVGLTSSPTSRRKTTTTARNKRSSKVKDTLSNLDQISPVPSQTQLSEEREPTTPQSSNSNLIGMTTQIQTQTTMPSPSDEMKNYYTFMPLTPQANELPVNSKSIQHSQCSETANPLHKRTSFEV
eukprot:gene6532-13226_t